MTDVCLNNFQLTFRVPLPLAKTPLYEDLDIDCHSEKYACETQGNNDTFSREQANMYVLRDPQQSFVYAVVEKFHAIFSGVTDVGWVGTAPQIKVFRTV